jgi:hypothetical protein
MGGCLCFYLCVSEEKYTVYCIIIVIIIMIMIMIMIIDCISCSTSSGNSTDIHFFSVIKFILINAMFIREQ